MEGNLWSGNVTFSVVKEISPTDHPMLCGDKRNPSRFAIEWFGSTTSSSIETTWDSEGDFFVEADSDCHVTWWSVVPNPLQSGAKALLTGSLLLLGIY